MVVRLVLTIFLINWFTFNIRAQQEDSFLLKLDSISNVVSVLKEKVDFTVNDIPLHEFIRGVANEVGLNVNLDQELDQKVSNNFSNVQVKDLLYFIHCNYRVNIDFIGNILNITKISDTKSIDSTLILIDYNENDSLLSIEAKDATLDAVLREVTRKTKINIVAKPNAKKVVLNIFIKDLSISNAFQKIAVANDLSLSKSENGLYILESIANDIKEVKTDDKEKQNIHNFGIRAGKGDGTKGYLNLKVFNRDSINISAQNADVEQVIQEVFNSLGISYQFIGELSEVVSLKKEGVSFSELLSDLFVGLKCSYRKVDNSYFIGARSVIEMKEVKVFPMSYRSIDSLQYIIPQNLKDGIEIIEYPDMNSLILAGSPDRVQNLQTFLKQVDKPIPVILIEMILIDNTNSKELTTGITAGLSDETVTTSGTILPSVDLTLSSGSINKILEGINGFGLVNLGKVNSNFYMTLSALDENGYVKIRSTPQLATMNGHAASMSIGTTEYYKEESSTTYASATSTTQTSTSYESVEAELKLEVKPIMSGNQDITMSISVEHSDFTDRIESTAPPGKVSRKFESMIRVKDQEMILLGGLEEAEKSDTRSGVPILSRIPILNWIFSSRSKVKSESKLNVFIKPTIIN